MPSLQTNVLAQYIFRSTIFWWEEHRQRLRCEGGDGVLKRDERIPHEYTGRLELRHSKSIAVPETACIILDGYGFWWHSTGSGQKFKVLVSTHNSASLLFHFDAGDDTWKVTWLEESRGIYQESEWTCKLPYSSEVGLGISHCICEEQVLLSFCCITGGFTTSSIVWNVIQRIRFV